VFKFSENVLFSRSRQNTLSLASQDEQFVNTNHALT